jgi:hypothetical protein
MATVAQSPVVGGPETGEADSCIHKMLERCVMGATIFRRCTECGMLFHEPTSLTIGVKNG